MIDLILAIAVLVLAVNQLLMLRTSRKHSHCIASLAHSVTALARLVGRR